MEHDRESNEEKLKVSYVGGSFLFAMAAMVFGIIFSYRIDGLAEFIQSVENFFGVLCVIFAIVAVYTMMLALRNGEHFTAFFFALIVTCLLFGMLAASAGALKEKQKNKEEEVSQTLNGQNPPRTSYVLEGFLF